VADQVRGISLHGGTTMMGGTTMIGSGTTAIFC
jgi:hypothetical protein